ncbi:hypothetical protein ACIQM3_10315 [Streptomyces sp. NPDC091271]|uniref:hypothetical protein n=1 Tax=Streptomyces sp. NPDC091271 TaxID=3365980 RepID=UPI0037FCA48B
MRLPADQGGATPGQVWGSNNDLRQYTEFDNAKSLHEKGNSCDLELPDMQFRGGPQALLRGYGVRGTNDTKVEESVASVRWVCRAARRLLWTADAALLTAGYDSSSR